SVTTASAHCSTPSNAMKRSLSGLIMGWTGFACGAMDNLLIENFLIHATEPLHLERRRFAQMIGHQLKPIAPPLAAAANETDFGKHHAPAEVVNEKTVIEDARVGAVGADDLKRRAVADKVIDRFHPWLLFTFCSNCQDYAQALN